MYTHTICVKVMEVSRERAIFRMAVRHLCVMHNTGSTAQKPNRKLAQALRL